MVRRWSPEEEESFVARRRRRSIVIGVVLGALAALFYGITISRMTL
jgi:hypothetical protein